MHDALRTRSRHAENHALAGLELHAVGGEGRHEEPKRVAARESRKSRRNLRGWARVDGGADHGHGGLVELVDDGLSETW